MNSTHRRPPPTAKSSRLGMREIARLVGVSPITVSRALNDPDKVSPETRDRVLRAIERAGFIPNQLASSMRGPGRIIGTMVPPLINSGIAEQVQGMSDESLLSGYQLLLVQGDFTAAAEEKAVRSLLGWRPAGLILQAFVQSGRRASCSPTAPFPSSRSARSGANGRSTWRSASPISRPPTP